MNVTVHIPPPLVSVFEGRRVLTLGVPEGAELADLLQTLFALYPKAWFLLPHEGAQPRVQLSLFTEPWPEGPLKLREGQPVVLTCAQPTRLADIQV